MYCMGRKSEFQGNSEQVPKAIPILPQHVKRPKICKIVSDYTEIILRISENYNFVISLEFWLHYQGTVNLHYR